MGAGIVFRVGFNWDRVVVAFVAVGAALVGLGALGGRRWFGPGWMVLAALGVMFIVAGLAMAYSRAPQDPPR